MNNISNSDNDNIIINDDNNDDNDNILTPPPPFWVAPKGVPAALLRGPGDPRLARQRGAAGLGERGSAIIL